MPNTTKTDALTLLVAGPFPTRDDAAAYLRRHARERAMSRTGGLYVAEGWPGAYYVRERI